MLSTRAAVLALLTVLAANAVAEPTVQKNIEYAQAPDRALHLDLYLPDRPSGAPLLVWVHGGAWEAGSKAQMPLEAFVEHGFAIASLDFRPASAARFPGQVHDIKAAVRYLRAEARRFDYAADRIAILGASSGAHLAALVGVTAGDRELEGTLGEHLDQSSAVQAIVSYFGASNLTTILAQSTPFGTGVRTPALTRLLGTLPAENESLAKLASPVFHVDAADPPLLLLHGDQDPQMPINQSHELQGAYERAGLTAEFIVVHGVGHGGDEFYAGRNFERVAAFLDTQLRPQGRRGRNGT
jgi:acetyl esterase/lipase